jgi:hypothetical protein
MRPRYAFGLLGGALLGLGMHSSAGPPAARPLRACGALIIGFLMVWWQVRAYEQLRLPEDFDERLLCNVTIVDPPLRRGDEFYFSARLESDALAAPPLSFLSDGRIYLAPWRKP